MWLASYILIAFCLIVGSLVHVRYYAGFCSSCDIGVWGLGWVFFFFWVLGVVFFLNLPERFLLLTKQTTNDSISPVGQRTGSTRCQHGPKVLPWWGAPLFYPNFKLLCMKRISRSPRGTSRQLIQDADEEELKHPLQPRMSQEQTTIFATIDCRGACPMLLTSCSTIWKLNTPK